MQYEWIDNWGGAPMEPTADYSGRTHGIVATASNQIIVFRQSNPAVLVYDTQGTLLDAWGAGFNGAHGMTLVNEQGQEFLWLTDTRGAMVKTTLTGEIVQELPAPDLPFYRTGKFSPTWIAVNEEGCGGNGDVWVADGYGQSYVHRYDKRGAYFHTISGEEGAAGRFNCPHGIWMDNRTTDRTLLIADRGQRRIQVYDLEGNYLRVFGADLLTSPCSFASDGSDLLIPELRVGLTILDAQGALRQRIGWNEEICQAADWPNGTRDKLGAGRFNSPHAATADHDGNLYVVEWMTVGRVTKLKRIG
ncbi:MAG: hypothetical protein SF339_11470 [Blastocatellia bacterium]|nr:hypothetical protein [Blastocatellia bacterium]